MARKCDLCGALHSHAKGIVTIVDISMDTDDTGTADGWTEIDFCGLCSKKLIDLIGPALDNLPPR